MANKQRLLIVLLVLGIFDVITHVDSKCPNDTVCDCTDDYIKCNCSNREEITFDGTTEGDERFTGEEIVISRCRKVKIIKLSLGDLNLESLHISDVLELHIESFSFYKTEVNNLYISRIENLMLESQAFGDMKQITNLTMNEVTVRELEPSIFSKTAVLHLFINDSRIGTMKSRSLEPLNCETFTIKNSGIHNVSASAINVPRASKFRFLRNFVNVTEISSFTLPDSKEVEFGHCKFLQISSNMVSAKPLETFLFHDNTVITSEEKSFWSIQPTKQVHFVANRIMTAKADSLIPNNGPNDPALSIIVSEDNKVGCTCNIEWLIKSTASKYNFFKERNKCYYPQSLEGFKLSALTVRKDREGNCSFLADSTAGNSAFINTLTTTEGESIGLSNTTVPSGAIQQVQQVATETGEPRATFRDHASEAAHSSEERRTAPCQNKDEPKNSSNRIAVCSLAFVLIPLVTS